MRTPLYLVLACSLCSCSEDAESGSDRAADVLFVVDTSPSTYDELADLGLAFQDAFVAPLESRGVDLHLAQTSLSVAPGPNVDQYGEPYPGYNGVLAGNPNVVPADDAPDFLETLLCQQTNWPNPCDKAVTSNCIEYDKDYQCGDSSTTMSWEYLACVCGNRWVPTDPVSSLEEGLAATVLSLCRATDLSSADSVVQAACSQRLLGTTAGRNSGLLRADTPLTVVIVTDEGDSSYGFFLPDESGHEKSLFVDGESDASAFIDLLSHFGIDIRFVVFGPYLEDGAACDKAPLLAWQVERYQHVTSATDGSYQYLLAPDGEYVDKSSCVKADFGALLGKAVDLIAAP
jgi:hypothetical protein